MAGASSRVFHRLASRQLVLSEGLGRCGAAVETSLLDCLIETGGACGRSFSPQNGSQDRGGTPGNAPFQGGAARAFFTLQRSGGGAYRSTASQDGSAPDPGKRDTDWWPLVAAIGIGAGVGSYLAWNKWASDIDRKHRNYSKWAIHSTDLMVEHNSRLESVEQQARGLDERLQLLESSLPRGGSGASGRARNALAEPSSLAGLESRIAKLEEDCESLINRDASLARLHPMSLNTYSRGTTLDYIRDRPDSPPHVSAVPIPPTSLKRSDDFSVPTLKKPPTPDGVTGGSGDANLTPPAGGGKPGPESALLTRDTIANAAAKAAPAVVNISSTGKWGILTVQNEGSGFIVESDGTILTNAHVVISSNVRAGSEKSNNQLLVTLEDGRTYDGEVVSYDTLADLAVVKIQTPTPLPTVQLGVSSTLRPGDWVLALGSPHNLPHTVTAGIISCVDRKSSEMGLTGIRSDYLQTDAAVNQGNSGGPLVNLDGEVIGINTMKLRGTDGVSFAIPIDTAVKVVAQLKKYGRVRQPFVGIKMLELNSQVSRQLKERHPQFPNVDAGILVAQVIPGSPAARAGMANGDIIVEFDGTPITKIKQLLDILGDRVGEEITVKVKRQADEDVTLCITTEEARGDL